MVRADRRFYETEVPEVVTAATWERMLAPGSPLFGRIAEWDGQVAGFAISVLHEGSWTTRPCCYLEDLFVVPELRGDGHCPRAHRGSAQALPPTGLGATLSAYARFEPRGAAALRSFRDSRRFRPLPHNHDRVALAQRGHRQDGIDCQPCTIIRRC